MNARILTVALLASAMMPLVGHAQAAGGHVMHDMHDMDMPAAVASATTSVPVAAETESTKAFKAADAKMHKAMMGTTYTGDADVDFLRGMIPHHQGAVDMANIVLKYGTDPDVRMLAGDIIKAQEKEIRWMRDWLAKHGPKDASASDARADAPAAKPLPAAEKTVVKPAKEVKTVNEVPAAKVVETQSVAEVSATGVVSSSELTPMTETLRVDADVPANPAAAALSTDLPPALAPDMPEANEEIENAAPRMELLDTPVAKSSL